MWQLAQILEVEPAYFFEGADELVIVTEWNPFRQLDLERLKRHLKVPAVVDLRNIYDPAEMKRLGFSYRCVGRPGFDAPSGS